jgi:hypothetical protein
MGIFDFGRGTCSHCGAKRKPLNQGGGGPPGLYGNSRSDEGADDEVL